MRCETIDAKELAKRWGVSVGWIERHSRQNYTRDPIPHVRLGRVVRYEWSCERLQAWWDRQQCCEKQTKR